MPYARAINCIFKDIIQGYNQHCVFLTERGREGHKSIVFYCSYLSIISCTDHHPCRSHFIFSELSHRGTRIAQGPISSNKFQEIMSNRL